MDVPVVTAAWFECDVVEGDLLARHGGKVAVADEILGISRVGLADGEDHLALEGCLGVVRGRRVGPYILGQAESTPSVGPSSVKCNVCQHLGYLGACHAVLFGELQVVAERRIDDTLTHEGSDGDHTAVVRAKSRSVPDFAEKHVIVQFTEFGCELTELRAAGILGDFSCAIILCVLKANAINKSNAVFFICLCVIGVC